MCERRASLSCCVYGWVTTLSLARKIMDWLNDRAAVRAHLASHNALERLDADGFVRIKNFLPAHVAEVAHDMCKNHTAWEAMDDGEIAYRNDAVHHSFQFAEPDEHPKTLGVLAEAVAMLFDELVPSFSIAKYGRGDSIAPHDDKAHVDVDGVLHSRKIAGILYLAKNWKAKFGGALVDLEAEAEHVPSFNTFVAFKVPRMHFVAPVLVDNRPRLSVFGWWLQPGRLYELDVDGEEAGEGTREEEQYVDIAEIVAAQQRGTGRKGRAGGSSSSNTIASQKRDAHDHGHGRRMAMGGVKKRRRGKGKR